MDSTPAPDIPDPELPTQVRGSRIRSRPVSSVGPAPRLPGTYAANYGGDDMDWRRGVVWLWVLFGLAAALEIIRASCYLLAGDTGWPGGLDALRIVVSTLVFLTLWLGWRWPRWLLVLTDTLSGLWLVIWAFAGHMGAGGVLENASTTPLTSALAGIMPMLALGFVYLATAAYLGLSADVVDFLRHRREEGRGWVFVPVTLLGGIYLLVVLTLQPVYFLWLGWQTRGARTAGGDLIRTMSSRWDAEAIVPHLDAAIVRAWPVADRKYTFASLSTLGPVAELDRATLRPLSTRIDPINGGFELYCQYDTGRAAFAHGHARISFLLTKHPFGTWLLDDFAADNLETDPPR